MIFWGSDKNSPIPHFNRWQVGFVNQLEAIGSIGLMPGKDVHRFTAEIGYWLAEPFWGKGIMTQAVKVLTAYGIHDFGLHRIFAEPYVTNSASARVLEKSGFTCEGILRSRWQSA